MAEAEATAATTAVATEVATASAPHESPRAHGRPGDGAAAARTELLFTEYGRTVSGLCQALLRNRAEAEDAAQQTFLSAHRALLNGSEPREPAAWLATIARNECWARIRTRMREPLPVEELETVATTNDPLAEAIRSADLAALWHAIEALPRQQRDALLLREFGGLTYDELSSALSVSGAAVESLLFRARHRLRGKLRAVYASLSGASWIDALVRLLGGRRRRPRRGKGRCARGRRGGYRKLRGRRAVRLRQPPAGPRSVARSRCRCPPEPRRADQGSPSGSQSRRLGGRSARARPGHAPRGTARREIRRGETRPGRQVTATAATSRVPLRAQSRALLPEAS